MPLGSEITIPSFHDSNASNVHNTVRSLVQNSQRLILYAKCIEFASTLSFFKFLFPLHLVFVLQFLYNVIFSDHGTIIRLTVKNNITNVVQTRFNI